MRLIIIFHTALISLFLACNLFAFDSFSTTVDLCVSGTPNIEKRAVDYLTQALNILGDVTIIKGKANWRLDIVISELFLNNNQSSGYTLACAILRSFKNDDLIEMIDKNYCKKEEPLGIHLNKKICTIISDPVKYTEFVTEDLVNYYDLIVFSGPSLIDVCKRTVTHFDRKHLSEERKWHARVTEGLRLLPERLEKMKKELYERDAEMQKAQDRR